MNHATHGWERHDPADSDIRKNALSYAILAPSPHNTQPWIVEFDGSLRISLFIDQERLLPACDPELRRVCVSHGSFIENFTLAAGYFGYRADIDLFPGGWPGNALDLEKPVARIDLEKDVAVEKDTLFEQIQKRETNRRVFRKNSITDHQVSVLSEASDVFTPISIVADNDVRETLANYIVKAMEIEVSNQDRITETLARFRFNDQEAALFRDGFGFAQFGSGGISRRLAGHFAISREKAEQDISSLGREAVKLTRKQAFSAAAYAWISTKGNNRMDQIKAGRCYERACLKATEMGLAIQPFSQVLSEHQDMIDLREQLREYIGISGGHTLQMLFRIGYADPVPHTPRRPVDDFVRKRA